MRRLLVPLRFVLVFALLEVVAGCSGGGGSQTASDSRHELIGNASPEVAGESANGRGKISLRGMKGRVVLVDFWATWCDPCKKSFPKLRDLNTKYNASGLEIIGVSEDEEPEAIAPFADNYNARFPLVWDEKGKLAKAWRAPKMPTTFVVDSQGVVRFVHGGFQDGDEIELEREIKQLLAEIKGGKTASSAHANRSDAVPPAHAESESHTARTVAAIDAGVTPSSGKLQRRERTRGKTNGEK